MLGTLKSKGQALVEFALISVLLMLSVMVIIEGSLVLQSYLAIQHAAREAARFAVTYQPPFRYTLDQAELLKQGLEPGDITASLKNEQPDEWEERRIQLIKERALQQAVGVSYTISKTDEINYLDTFGERVGFLGFRVGRDAADSDDTGRECGDYVADEGICWDKQGLPDEPVLVRVDYRWRPIDPLLSGVWPNGIPLRGQVEMVNEGTQWSRFAPTREVPPVPTGYQPTPTNTPTNTPGPSPTPTNTPTNTPTPTSTATPTPTPTLTPTPAGAYLVLAPIKDVWPEEILPGGVVELHNHFPNGRYDIFWTDNCGVRTDLGLPVDSFAGAAAADLPEPAEVRPGFRYLCPPVEGGRSYTCTLSTSLASLDVAVQVPISPPDLIVQRAFASESAVAGEAITVSVEVRNVGRGIVSDRFPVDIYVNPDPGPVSKGQPGKSTGGGSPTQWVSEVISPGMNAVLNYVISAPATGKFTFWAQADTTNNVRELDEDNNILGPIWFSLSSGVQDTDTDRDGEPPQAASPIEGQPETGAGVRSEALVARVWRSDEATPTPHPAKAYTVGGQALVVLDGTPTRLGGIDVWAVRLQDGSTPEEEQYQARSAEDASYRFYNLSPGRYRVYAEVWVSGRLYSASTTIEVQPGEVRTDVELSLL